MGVLTLRSAPVPRFLIVLASLLAVPFVLSAQTERVTLSGDDIAIYNLVGSLRVEPGSGSLAVEVTRTGADAAKLRLDQGEIDGRTTLRVVYPGDRIRALGREGGSTELRVRTDGTFGDDDWGHGRHGDRRNDGRDERGRRVTITERGDGLDARADLVVRVPQGARVSLHLAVGNVSVTNVEGELSIEAHNAPVSASGTKGSLQVAVGSGQVELTQATGEVDIATGSGAVALSRVQGHRLGVSTGSGDVTGGDLTADELEISTGSGDIRLSGVASSSVSFQTGSGVVDADLRQDVSRLTAETGSGDIAIRAPASLGAAVEIETASGDIETDFPLEVTRHGRDHVVGKIGDGKGSIAIETASGGIRLLKRPN